jgi:hypothetical protein
MRRTRGGRDLPRASQSASTPWESAPPGRSPTPRRSCVTRTGASSTDANIPIALGIPGIRVGGGGNGGGAHSLDEWYDDGPRGWLGPQWSALLVARLAGVSPPR